MKRILYFSCVEWNGQKQRSHFLAQGLSEQGYEITYLTYNLGTAQRKTVRSGVLVCSERGPRGYMRSRIVRAMGRGRLEQALADHEYDLLILTNPVQIELIPDRLTSKPIIYDCMDLMGEFYKGRQKALLLRLEGELCRRAVRIIVSAEPLVEYLRREYNAPKERMSLLHNAFDRKDCQAAQTQALLHPALIYMGAVDWWFDMETVATFMAEHPDVQLYVVGQAAPEQERALARIPNCCYTGPLSHVKALGYVKGADVALLPFLPVSLVSMVDPVKLYEYLALGKPVVSAYWKALEHFKETPGLLFYDNKRSFAQSVKQALASATQEVPTYGMQDNWDTRTAQLVDMIESIKL